MSMLCNSDRRDRIREKLLETLDGEFGDGVIRDEHLPEIFRHLDDILEIAEESDLHRSWQYLYGEDLPRKHFDHNGVFFPKSLQTDQLGDILIGTMLDDKLSKNTFIKRVGENFMFGPIHHDTNVFNLVKRLNSDSTLCTLRSYMDGLVVGDRATIMGKEVIDVHRETDTTHNGIEITTVCFTDTDQILPTDIMVVVENSNSRR